jgi:hypothetical protein
MGLPSNARYAGCEVGMQSLPQAGAMGLPSNTRYAGWGVFDLEAQSTRTILLGESMAANIKSD